jgi:hypothetical protein
MKNNNNTPLFDLHFIVLYFMAFFMLITMSEYHEKIIKNDLFKIGNNYYQCKQREAKEWRE